MPDDLVKVAVRIRPLSKSELEHNSQECLQVIPGEPQVYIKSQDKSFTYNYVFPPSVGQAEFYQTAIKQLIPNIFKGFNVTILAYGQTGSGKTYSMGTNYSPDGGNDQDGVIPRAVKDIFNTVQNEESEWSYRITVSFVELYQEMLYDLLANKTRNQCVVELREEMKKIVIVGLTERPVNNAAETLSCLAKGSTFRATGSTAMNEQSSRSHAVFTITVHQENKADRANARTSKFHLVDLAGSERSKKTQATGQTFREGVEINKGLLVLGNVISQLGEGNPGAFVNYRDSKLTRLLQDSLGGNSMTLMIACVSPSDYNVDETLSTLRYADRARKIKNKPIVNEDPKVAEVNRLNKIIESLTKQLQAGGGTICPPEHEELREKVRSYTKKLNENYVELVMLHEKYINVQEISDQVIEKLKSLIKDVEEEEQRLIDDDNSSEFKNVLKNYLSKLYETLAILCPSEDSLSQKDDSISEKGNTSQNDSLDISNSFKSDCDSLNLTYNIDKEHEEHTNRQAERHSQVSYIDKQLAAKENMMATLLRNASLTLNHEKEIEDMENEIKKLQAEKQSLEETLRNVQVNSKSSKIAETRRKKIQELEKKISDLTTEQLRIKRNKEKLDVQINSLKNEMQSMKKTKVTLIKQIRTEADKFNKWKLAHEREVNKLKAQDRKKQSEIVRLQMNQAKQNIVYKRKMEESQAIQKKLKLALEKHKSAQDMRDNKFVKKPVNSDAIQNQIKNELDIIFHMVEAENNLQKIIGEKNHLTDLLNKAKQVDSKTKEDEACIAELESNLHLKYTQMLQLENLIKEYKKENSLENVWKTVKSMPEAKTALKIFIEQFSAEYKNKIEKLQTENDQNEKEEISTSDSDDDNNIDGADVETLKQKLEHYKSITKKIKDKISEKAPIKQYLPVPLDNLDESITDESMIMDDADKDPDWTKTPLFQRLHRIDDRSKSRLTFNKPMKRSSSNDLVTCNCKTQCKTRICSCRKNGELCRECNCNPDICQNRQEDSKRRLFEDITNSEESGIESKKLKYEVKGDSEQEI